MFIASTGKQNQIIEMFLVTLKNSFLEQDFADGAKVWINLKNGFKIRDTADVKNIRLRNEIDPNLTWYFWLPLIFKKAISIIHLLSCISIGYQSLTY